MKSIMCSLSVCCCAALLLLLLLRCMLGRRSVPCLPRVPVLGSLLHLRSSLPPHLLLTQLSHRYGPLFGLYSGPHFTLVVSEISLVREVLLQRGREFAGRPKMVTTDVLTQGGKDIAFADYSPLWKNHRRLVHNSFTLFGEGSGKLQTIVQEAAEDLCEELRSCSGQSSDLSPVLMRAVTNVICRLVFSSSYQRNDPEFLTVMDYNDGIVQTIARGGLVDIFPWLRIFPNKDLKKLKQCVSVRDQLLHRKLLEHKMTLTPGEPRDLLDALLIGQMKGSGGEDDITEDHVLMTAAEAFGAGVETTSTTLLLGGHSVPKGTRVLVNMWAIHHDPKHWDEPEQFRPERFLDASGRRVTPSSFLPFGAGPRVCVGESLARIELFLFASRLLQRFHFSVPPGASLPELQGRFGVVLQPQSYSVTVTPRH
ncbi:hypothetical protein cypCar_00041718 [Cyprinus carpio]|nr:hypothetical protein cypCar_00041718 [Cyprinus carpio]